MLVSIEEFIMKRLLISIVLGFSVASVAAGEFISSTGGEIQALNPQAIPLVALPQVDCAVDQEPLVAMVTTNGFNSGTATTLVADLAASGFTVRDLDITGGNIPDCVTKLYISSEAFGGCLDTPFGALEEAAIVNWILAGGEAWINGEWGTGCGDGTESLIENFVTSANIDSSANGPFFDGVHFDSTIPATATLFAGVNSYQQFAGSHFVDAAGSPDVVVADPDPVMVAGEFGLGCVVIMGDSNWPHDFYIDNSDNRQLANNAIAFINECSIRVIAEKSWTHTDYNWGPVCDGIVIGNDCVAPDGTVIPFRDANIYLPGDDVLADPLPITTVDDGDKYTAFAVVNKEKFQNTTPGAFYALTTIEVVKDVDSLWVDEIYADCTQDGDGMLQFVSRKATRNVKVAAANPNGDVTELTDDLYDGIGGSITADLEMATVHVTDASYLTAGSMVFVLVKFENNLKGEFVPENSFDDMCDNVEDVTVGIGDLSQTVTAEAALRITNN
jgi:hypothetical protein